MSLNAARDSRREAVWHHLYLGALPDDPYPFHADQWQRSLSMMESKLAAKRGYVLIEAITNNGIEPYEAARLARSLLEGRVQT